MTMQVNLNADMGEGFGVYEIGHDAALLKIVKSANIACGFHGGDWRVMRRLTQAAAEQGVSIGAHPGFNDLWGFGRRRIEMAAEDVEYMVAYQIGALQALAGYAGAKVTHVKPHGALSNMAAEDEELAMAVGRAIKAVDPSLIYLAPAGSKMEKAARRLSLKLAREGFADRLYADDGRLVPRSLPGAVLSDPIKARAQAVRMVRDRQLAGLSGKIIPIEVESVCIHGDEPNALVVAAEVRRGLEEAGVKIVTLPEMRL